MNTKNIEDHNLEKKEEIMVLEFGKANSNQTSNDTHTGVSAYISKKTDKTVIAENHYDVLENGSVRMGCSTTFHHTQKEGDQV
jgi:hypothetical protein